MYDICCSHDKIFFDIDDVLPTEKRWSARFFVCPLIGATHDS